MTLGKTIELVTTEKLKIFKNFIAIRNCGSYAQDPSLEVDAKIADQFFKIVNYPIMIHGQINS